MRMLSTLSAMVLGAQLQASDLHVVVRTTDAEIIKVSVVCPGDSALVVTNQYEIRVPGSASWRAAGGVPPYRLVSDEPGQGGIVCFTVVDAAGQEARGCGVIGELRSSRFEACNGGRSDGIPSTAAGAVLFVPDPPVSKVSSRSAEEVDGPRSRPVRRSATGLEPVSGDPPVRPLEPLREVRPTGPSPRPQQRGYDDRGTPPRPTAPAHFRLNK